MQEKSDDQEKHIQDQKNDKFAVGKGNHLRCQFLRNLRPGQKATHQHRCRNKHHHHSRLHAAFKHRPMKLSEIDFTIPYANADRGQNSQTRSLGSGYKSTKNTAKNDDWQ